MEENKTQRCTLLIIRKDSSGIKYVLGQLNVTCPDYPCSGGCNLSVDGYAENEIFLTHGVDPHSFKISEMVEKYCEENNVRYGDGLNESATAFLKAKK